MPRKKQLNATRHESNEEKLKREVTKEKLNDYTGIQLSPPRHLSKASKAEWRRIQPLLEELPISSLDKTMVETYTNLYAIYLSLEKEIQDQGEMIEVLYADGSLKERKVNPAINQMLQVSKEIRAICSELGMTINSRMRLVEPTIEEDDPFASMFKEGE